MSDTFKKLKEQLALQEWPSVYLFKFIAPNKSNLVARISALFDDGADLKFTTSKTGKYISVSVKELMLDVDSIINKYEAAAKIEGVISL